MNISQDILIIIASYSTHSNIINLSLLNKSSYISLTNDIFWKDRCIELGIKQKSLRKRLFISWYQLYRSYLCWNCNSIGKGTCIIDIHGGSNHRYSYNVNEALIPICLNCLKNTQNYVTIAERKRNCLLNIKRNKSEFIWQQVLSKIPFDNQISMKKQRFYASKHDMSIDVVKETHQNNYLLKKLS